MQPTLQSDGKFNEHKLVKANKRLHVVETLRKDHYSQAEIDHLSIFIVLRIPKLSYALSVYGASESDPQYSYTKFFRPMP